jgi:hypothetical protein
LRDALFPDEIHTRKFTGHCLHEAGAICPFVRGEAEDLALLSVEGGEG